jgi:hypothetical protein
MQKISTMRTSGKKIFKGQLTIGLDLGDRSSSYCVLNEAGEIVLEQKLPTTPEAMKQTFAKMPRGSYYFFNSAVQFSTTVRDSVDVLTASNRNRWPSGVTSQAQPFMAVRF